MDKDYDDYFLPINQSVIETSNQTFYSNYLHNITKKAYEAVMATLDESVHEYEPFKPVNFEPQVCGAKSESEIFSSKSDIEEQSLYAACPKFETLELTKDPPRNQWWGAFNGFNIKGHEEPFDINENRKCVELSLFDQNPNIEKYLMSGVRCFIIDLFAGTETENLSLISKLREAEIVLSKENLFPITSTLVARLSPRHQYTGYLDPPDLVLHLNLRDSLTLSTDRHWSTRGSQQIVYVNARILVETVKACDVLAVGPKLQLTVKAVDEFNIYTVVSRAGELRSRSCILFPPKTDRYRVSWEEIECLTFAQASNISIVTSYIVGTPAYVEDLRKIFQILRMEYVRLLARLSTNEIKGCDYDMQWVAEAYDGFIMDFKTTTDDKPQRLVICPNAICLLDRAFERGKAILLELNDIVRRKLLISDENYRHLFLYPDKYIVRSTKFEEGTFFFLLMNEYMKPYAHVELAQQPYCDVSHTGVDTLARAAVAASYETQAKAFIVTSRLGLMGLKISKFRPAVPIIFVSRTRELEEYAMMYYNVILLHIPTQEKLKHQKLTLREFFLGIKFLVAMRLIKENDYLMLVYSMKSGVKFLDKFAKYQYHALTFKEDLSKNLFDE